MSLAAEERELLYIKPKLAARVKTTWPSHLVLQHRAGCCSRWRGWSPGHIWTSAAPRVSGPAPGGRTPSHWASRSWPWRFPWKIRSAQRNVYESESVDYCVSQPELSSSTAHKSSIVKKIHTPSAPWTSTAVCLYKLQRAAVWGTYQAGHRVRALKVYAVIVLAKNNCNSWTLSGFNLTVLVWKDSRSAKKHNWNSDSWESVRDRQHLFFATSLQIIFSVHLWDENIRKTKQNENIPRNRRKWRHKSSCFTNCPKSEGIQFVIVWDEEKKP